MNLKLPDMPQIKLYAGIAAVIAIVVATLVFAWKFWGPQPVKPEVYAAAQRQADNSLVLEKKPDATAKPAAQLPEGSKVQRLAQVTVQATAKKAASATGTGTTVAAKDGFNDANLAAVGSECPPVTVDLTLVKMPDDSQRVVASSPDGKILKGVDIPVVSAQPAPTPKLWAAGASFDPFKRTFGVIVERDLGPFRLGTEVHQTREDSLNSPGVRVSALLQF